MVTPVVIFIGRRFRARVRQRISVGKADGGVGHSSLVPAHAKGSIDVDRDPERGGHRITLQVTRD